MSIIRKKEKKTKNPAEPNVEVQVKPEKISNKDPLLLTIDYIKENNNELVNQNLRTFKGIQDIQNNIEDLASKNQELSSQCSEMNDTFENIIQVTERFAEVQNDIDKSVSLAQNQVEILKDSSNTVTDRFEEMNDTFNTLLASVDKIKSSTEGIIAIANQTNLL